MYVYVNRRLSLPGGGGLAAWAREIVPGAAADPGGWGRLQPAPCENSMCQVLPNWYTYMFEPGMLEE